MKPAPLPPNEVGRVAALRALEILDTAPEPAFDDIARIAATICRTPIALVSLVDRDRQWSKARIGMERGETPRDVAFCAHAILGEELFVVPDLGADERFADNPAVAGEPRVRFYAGMPLSLPEGYALGTLCVLDCEPRHLDENQREALRALGRQVVAQLELRRRTRALEEELRGRKEIERFKNEFISVVSHELRTPLTSVRGSLGLLEGGVAGELAEGARELVRIARANTDRLIRLINDILDLDKIEAGKMELRPEWLQPAELARAAADGLRAIADQAGVGLVVKAPGGLPSVVGDRDRLLQVLTNLISNAIKFSPHGAPVTVQLERAGGTVRFSVRDQGPGIAPAQLPRLWHKFQQLDSSDARRKGGTGLGLAITKALVEQHGGRVGVSSQVGEGSAFWFEVPAAEMRGHGRAVGLPPYAVLPVEPAADDT